MGLQDSCLLIRRKVIEFSYLLKRDKKVSTSLSENLGTNLTAACTGKGGGREKGGSVGWAEGSEALLIAKKHGPITL